MNRRNRRFPSFFDIDEMFGLDIQRIMDEMDAVMKQYHDNPDHATGKPVYYGYSVEVGPDGKPHIKEWGNAKPARAEPSSGCASCKQPEDRHNDKAGPACETITEKEGEDGTGPYTCTMFDEKKNELKIHADIPGISKDDIDLELKDGKLILDARTENRYYHKEIPIDHDLSSKDIKANYNNGLLEITLKCKKPASSEKAQKINVE